eukprot:763505-Hanusia_phi.AAC.2
MAVRSIATPLVILHFGRLELTAAGGIHLVRVVCARGNSGSSTCCALSVIFLDLPPDLVLSCPPIEHWCVPSCRAPDALTGMFQCDRRCRYPHCQQQSTQQERIAVVQTVAPAFCRVCRGTLTGDALMTTEPFHQAIAEHKGFNSLGLKLVKSKVGFSLKIQLPRKFSTLEARSSCRLFVVVLRDRIQLQDLDQAAKMSSADDERNADNGRDASSKPGLFSSISNQISFALVAVTAASFYQVKLSNDASARATSAVKDQNYAMGLALAGVALIGNAAVGAFRKILSQHNIGSAQQVHLKSQKFAAWTLTPTPVWRPEARVGARDD